MNPFVADLLPRWVEVLSLDHNYMFQKPITWNV